MGIERWPAPMRVEVRSDKTGKRVIAGYAAVFGQLSEDLGGFREQISPGAFKASLAGDVRALWNHNTDVVLGRTTAGTLRLHEDAHGLAIEIDPPESAGAYVEALERGDVSQMSFGFHVERDQWAQVEGRAVRTLLQVRLLEVSPVTFPAYHQTAVGVRALYGALPEIPESIRRAPVENTPRARADTVTMERRGETMDKTEPMAMRRRAAGHLERAQQLDALANAENRLMTEEERGEYDLAVKEHARLLEQAQRAEELQTEAARGESLADRDQRGGGPRLNLRYGSGDTETKAFLAYLRRGDAGGLLQLRASNNTDMNIGTPADGGYAVPTGLYERIIAKRNEAMLARRLGVLNVPGRGTTVNVAVDAGTANEFVATNEAAGYDNDAPALGQKPLTLAKYTKKTIISEELLEDEDARVMDFVADYVGRALALTHNKLLWTEALAGGTSVSLTGGSGAFAVGHITQMVYGLKGEYTDGAQWIMRRATQGAIQATQGNAFVYLSTPQGGPQTLWGFPLVNSEWVAAYALNAKPLVFGNFAFMGMREAPGLTLIRDPYTLSANGQVLFTWRFRTVYKVLLAEAILYGTAPAS